MPTQATHNRLNVFTVTEYDATDDHGHPTKARAWNKVGVAFPHKDGTGFNIQLAALPLNGTLVALPPDTEEEEEEPELPLPPPEPREHNRRRR